MLSLWVPAALVAAVLSWSRFASAQTSLGLTVDGNGSSTAYLEPTDPVAVAATLAVDLGNPYLSSGYAGGAADLTTGTLRVTSEGVFSDTSYNSSLQPVAEASLGDTIVIHGPGTTVLLTMSVALDGSFGGGGTGSSGSDYAQGVVVDVGTVPVTTHKVGSLGLTWYGNNGDGGGPPTFGGSPTGDPNVVFGGTPSAMTLRVTFSTMVNVGSNVPIFANLRLNSVGNYVPGFAINMDFGNTARLTITLPDGYTYTSQSGVLLTNSGGTGLEIDGGDAPLGSDAGSRSDAGVVGGDGGIAGDGGAGGNDRGDAGSDANQGSSSGCAVGGVGGAAGWGLVLTLAALMKRQKRRARL